MPRPQPHITRLLRRALSTCALLLCALCAHAQTGGAITGRVIDDAGQPVVNAHVFISTPPRSAHTMTDTEGKFSFDNLARGAYTVSANAPGYFDPTTLAFERNERTYYRPGDSVTIRLGKGGVITGRVRDAGGEPIVAVRVQAIRVRALDLQQQPDSYMPLGGRVYERTTDDRGVYRFYGLLPGVYLVAAGGNGLNSFSPRPAPYDDDVQTFYPATTRDGARELVLHEGQELPDVDIRYRGEPGHAISGRIENAGNTPVALTIIPAGFIYVVSNRFLSDRANSNVFIFEGLADGDYDLVAEQYTTGATPARTAAASQRITVRGADVTGLKLTLAPLAAVTGRVVLEAAPQPAPWKEQCQTKLDATMGETLINAQREPEARTAARTGGLRQTGAVPDDKGEFALRGLTGGRFRFTVRPPGPDWYVRAATLAPTPAPGSKRAPAPTRAADTNPLVDGLTLAAGTQTSDLTFTLTPGAAELTGRITAASAGATLPALQVFLVPVERERADDVLRYAVTRARADATFAFTHLAPGRYQLLAERVPDGESVPPTFDAQMRARLRRDAETQKHLVELQPCQRIDDFTLSFPATKN